MGLGIFGFFLGYHLRARYCDNKSKRRQICNILLGSLQSSGGDIKQSVIGMIKGSPITINVLEYAGV